MLVSIIDGNFVTVEGPLTEESCRVRDESVRAFMARLERPDCALPDPGPAPSERGPLTKAQAAIASQMDLSAPETLSLCASLEEMGRG